MKLPVHVAVYLQIEGLRDTKAPPAHQSIIPLTQNQYASSLKMLMPHHVENGGVYEPVIKDLREEAIGKISSEERKEIEEKFARIDSDGDGSVTLKEIREFYEKLIHSKKKNLLEKAKLIIDKKPGDKDRIEKMYERASSSLDNLVEISIKTFMKLDTDASNTIEFDEFLAHEAKILMAKKLKGKEIEL